MECLKCGREIPVGQVFCQDCLTEMEKYPVKPGTHVRIPKRQEAPAAKKQNFRQAQASPEVQVKRLRIRLRIVTALLVLVLLLTGALGWLTWQYVLEQEGMLLPGQNYSSASGSDSGDSGEP